MLNWYNEIGVGEVINDEPVNTLEAHESTILSDATHDGGTDFALSNLVNDSGLSRKLATSAKDIHQLFDIIRNFNGCKLKATATNTVCGEGVLDAEVMFIGEAPGATEDQEGRPFCGDSGKLLDNMIASIGLSRKTNMFITNNVYWRPPANRPPTKEELNICLPFLEKMIALINPKLIILVGGVAAANITGLNYSMAKFRTSQVEYINQYLEKPIKTFTIFHPAYLLRSPSQKKNAWFDLISIEEFIKNNNIRI
ncbi:MAG: uracil-DNA glycosylase [Sphingobacteriia bacterium]|nr:uracil-DNA glycosylase [Sphingobacteriia bacterium]